jgi:hypothetical protein
MEPTECAIEESHSGLYPMAGCGSGNIGNLSFCFLPKRQSATVMQDSNKHNSSVQIISLAFLLKQSKTYIYIYIYIHMTRQNYSVSHRCILHENYPLYVKT